MNEVRTATRWEGTLFGAGVSRLADKTGCFWTVGKEVWRSQWVANTL